VEGDVAGAGSRAVEGIDTPILGTRGESMLKTKAERRI
jgi:hypothetical protein